MHSFISNSDGPPQWPETYWKRPIPTAHWQGVSLLTVLLVLGFMIAWETWWRIEGYEPSFEETAELWAWSRQSAGTGNPDEIAYTGSSRIQFDLDLDAWEQDFGGPRPICLARVGTNPRPFITDIANDPDFRGLLLVGVTEGLFFSPDFAPPAQEAAGYIEHYRNRSLSARSDFVFSIPVESGFASINKEELSLAPLVRYRWFKLKNREGAYLLPGYPPYFGRITLDRRNHMWHKAERDPELQHRIQQSWLPLFSFAPPFGGPGLDELINSVKADVDKITARGGRVVFIRFPSTGELRALEKEMWPRGAYWDRLIRETGAPGIHFEDYETLKHFDCPEWSHLSRVDAVTFTRNLVPVIREKLAGNS